MSEINQLEIKNLGGMKVAFVVPGQLRPTLYSDWDLSLVDSVSPPLGLLSLAAIVRLCNGFPSLHDAYARRLNVEDTIKEVLSAKPDIVGISCMSHSYPEAKILIRKLKNAASQVKIIMGGVHITAVGKQIMDDIPELDFGVLREGEATLIELLDAIKTNTNLGAVKGILFRSKERIIETSEREFIRDLDILPFPAWDLLDGFPDMYRLSIVGTRSYRSTSLVTSRGCPGKCGFCDVGAVGGMIRTFSAGYVIRTIEHLMQNYGINDFLVYDDNFVTLKARTKQICEEIIKRKLNIHWSCSARVDMVNPEILGLMKNAGCWQIEYGIESGSQKILDLMHKNITLEQIRTALKWTKEAGIETRGNFIFGYPQETRQTLEESIQFSLAVDLDFFQQTFLTPYPGSQIYHEADTYGIFDRNLEKMNNLTINFIPHGFTEEELKQYSRKAFRQFYFRPKIILHHLAKIKCPGDIARLTIVFRAFLKTVLNKRYHASEAGK